ncbi:unnamed protein product [Diatraea saccharalis]|uniref:Fidgetin-like protein 1 n=1 Tax=Diatraea saccharalis TaxID=40085 RepID=A0A9N9W6W0_9NEOP|nr:unnamed protein product [Diatraea saccharalis]
MKENETFLFQDPCVDSKSILNNVDLHLYKLSTHGFSNISSRIQLNRVWESNKTLLNEKSDEILKHIHISTSKDNSRFWKSNLSKSLAPVALFEKSLPECTHCSKVSQESLGLDQVLTDKCACNLNIIAPSYQNQNNILVNKKPPSYLENLNSADSDGENKATEERQIFKPKFGRPKLTRVNQYSASKYTPISQNVDFEKEEEEMKAHKSNVAKITFKTAKEQFLASNPAAKRTLGTSKKAQAKFVSPMISAQEKQEHCDPVAVDDRLKHLDPKMIELIESEIIDKGTQIGWDDIAGLHMAKTVIQEAVVWPLLRPDIFTGLRRPPKGILLFGPPGTGKTLIGKCIAAQCHATFFSISASSLTSKWIGDGEKMVRALFAVARCRQPAVVFIDEIDSLLTQRNDTEHEATRRIKTEFLVQFDGAGTGEEDRLLIVGATNRPQELDEAARRRLVKRLYIPLPDTEARKQIISNLLKTERHSLIPAHIEELSVLSEGYSGADMRALCSEAAMGPVRAVPLSQIVSIDSGQVRPVNVEDFKNALQRVKPSVSQDDLGQYIKWNNTYGQGF